MDDPSPDVVTDEEWHRACAAYKAASRAFDAANRIIDERFTSRTPPTQAEMDHAKETEDALLLARNAFWAASR